MGSETVSSGEIGSQSWSAAPWLPWSQLNLIMLTNTLLLPLSQAIDVLTTYLTDSPIAPLNKEFVEIPEPYCTSLDIYTAHRVKTNELTVYLADVPAEHLETIDGLVKKALKRIGEEGIDMERMAMVLSREKRQTLHNLETRADSMVSQAVIVDLLYGTTDGAELQTSFDTMEHYAVIEKWTAKEWSDYLTKSVHVPAQVILFHRH